jgi:hypothetical protein
MQKYDVMSDEEIDGTITLDDAGVVTYTATPGNEAAMAELVDEPVLVRGGRPDPLFHRVPKPGQEPVASDVRSVTRQSDPAAWFKQLPIQFHGSRFRVVPTEG